MKDFRVKAIADEECVFGIDGITHGDKIVGYLNSWHKKEEWTVQVEVCPGVAVEGCSGIMVVDVIVKKESIKPYKL